MQVSIINRIHPSMNRMNNISYPIEQFYYFSFLAEKEKQKIFTFPALMIFKALSIVKLIHTCTWLNYLKKFNKLCKCVGRIFTFLVCGIKLNWNTITCIHLLIEKYNFFILIMTVFRANVPLKVLMR